MSISAISSSPVTQVSGGERAEKAGPDRDGDADDTAARQASPAVQSQPAPGTGKVVNKSA